MGTARYSETSEQIYPTQCHNLEKFYWRITHRERLKIYELYKVFCDFFSFFVIFKTVLLGYEAAPSVSNYRSTFRLPTEAASYASKPELRNKVSLVEKIPNEILEQSYRTRL